MLFHSRHDLRVPCACRYSVLQLFCNTCRFSATLCRFSATFCGFSAKPADFLQHSADFLQYLQKICNTADFLQNLPIFCNTCRKSATFCRISAIPADFLERHADFMQYLQKNCNTLQNFCGVSSDDINSCIAQRSSVVLFPLWFMVLSARLRTYVNFTRSQPRANYVTSMPLLSKAIYSCW